MRKSTIVVFVGAIFLGGIAALLWKRLEAEPPEGVRQSMPDAPLTKSESTISIAAPLPYDPPEVEPGTGDPDQVMAANDRNGDGVVTKEEAQAANKLLFQLWDLYDKNKDGFVNAAEIDVVNARYFADIKSRARQTGPDEIIRSNDKNDDGVVTREEARQTNNYLITNWSMYDLNKDGRTDRNEIATALRE